MRRPKLRRRRRYMGNPAPQARIGGSSYLLGTKRLVKHRFFETIALNPAAAGVSAFPYSTNGIQDPGAGGSAHQPRGFDQLAVLYAQYLVLKCHIKATFVNASSVAGDRYIVGIAHRSTVTADTTLEDYIENRNVVYKPLAADDGSTSVSMWCNAAKFSGYPRSGRGERVFHSVTTSVPEIQTFMHVFAASVVGSDPSALDVAVDITYFVEWTSPILPAVSTA